jgi:hypothetical protein
MGGVRDGIDEKLDGFLLAQHMFFTGTAPTGADGHVNVSPKGIAGSFAVLGPRSVAYLDLTGSGAETIAHVRENGRITLMWCAFEGPPRIVRVHGRGEILDVADERVAGLFPDHRGVRGVVLVHADRVSDSCGYAVPLYTFEGDRSKLLDWVDHRSDEELVAYRAEKNARSIDGLPAHGAVRSE